MIARVRPIDLVWLLLLTILAASTVTLARAQGFAGLGSDAEGFARPDPNYVPRFPEDHGPHPDHRIEWWYLTANLKGPDGRNYGAQWTLFRSALKPTDTSGWSSPQLWMGHAALTSSDQHFVSEVRARGGVGVAGVTTTPFHAWINDWSMKSTAKPGSDPLSSLSLSASGPAFSYRLGLSADGPLVLQGQQGYSVKSQSGQASHYYSQPFYAVSGKIVLSGEEIAVSGNAWLDREWSSQPLDGDQQGWDWISLHFDTGEKLMGFQLRSRTERPYMSANWISATGEADARSDVAGPETLKMSPLAYRDIAGRSVPIKWRVELAERNLDVTLEALNPDSWMQTSFPYWEGPVRVTGSHNGMGYLEMTGYPKTPPD